MRLALINPPQFSNYPQPPMGLALLGAVLEQAGHNVTIIDANALRLTAAVVAQQVSGNDVALLTAMTPTINTALNLASELKSGRANLPIILGGAHATLLPEETLTVAPDIDVIVKGEGEKIIIELLRAIETNQSLDHIQGITYRNSGRITSNPASAEYVDLDSLPFLAYHLLPKSRYRPHPPHGRSLPFAALITSRGCPYRCSYCSKPVFGKIFRGQSPQRVIEEVKYFKKEFGVKEIAFYDDVFTLDKKRAFAIADGLLRENIGLYWTCETRVNLVDRELLHHMRQAGCYAIAYGIESGSSEIREAIHKGISKEQIVNAIRMTHEVGLQTVGYFMIGSPGETPETIRSTIDFAKELRLDFAQFAITTPFPGTELYEIYMQGRTEHVPWDNFIYEGTGKSATPIFENEQLSRDDLKTWAKKAYRDFYLRPAYVWQRIRRIRSVGDVKVNAKGLAMLFGNIRK